MAPVRPQAVSTHTYIFTYIHIYIYIYTYIHIHIYIFTSHDGKHENTRLFLCSLSAKGTCGHTDNCTCPTCASLRRICLLVRTGLGHPCSPILPVLTFGNWRANCATSLSTAAPREPGISQSTSVWAASPGRRTSGREGDQA